jgi:hypothetical protein
VAVGEAEEIAPWTPNELDRLADVRDATRVRPVRGRHQQVVALVEGRRVEWDKSKPQRQKLIAKYARQKDLEDSAAQAEAETGHTSSPNVPNDEEPPASGPGRRLTFIDAFPDAVLISSPDEAAKPCITSSPNFSAQAGSPSVGRRAAHGADTAAVNMRSALVSGLGISYYSAEPSTQVAIDRVTKILVAIEATPAGVKAYLAAHRPDVVDATSVSAMTMALVKATVDLAA